MDVFNHFSCHSKLPVLLDHLIEHIMETGVVASIEIYSLDLNPQFLRGFCYVFVDRPHNSINHHRRAWIGYSKHLAREEARLVIAKELLHLLDGHEATAQSKAQVSDLIDQVVLSDEAQKLGLPALTDNTGLLLALAVLFPRDAIDELKAAGMSPETMAKHARLPLAYVLLALSPLWQKVLDSFTLKYPKDQDQLGLELGEGAEPTRLTAQATGNSSTPPPKPSVGSGRLPPRPPSG